MKSIIKKITAITMAFTLLGSGTAIAKNVSPKSDNTLTASAATCQHHGYHYTTRSNWRPVLSKSYQIGPKLWHTYQERTVYIRCGSCSKITSTYTESRIVYTYDNYRELW